MKFTEALALMRVNSGRSERTPLRLHLAVGFTPNHLATFVIATAAQRHADRFVTCTTGPYGDLIQAIDAAEAHACLVVVEWPDLDPRLGLRRFGAVTGRTTGDVAETVAARLDMLTDAVRRQAQHGPVAIALPSLPLPIAFLAAPGQTSRDEILLRSAVLAFAARCLSVPGVSVVQEDRLEQASPIASRHAVSGDLGADMPYAPGHLAALAAALIASALPPAPLKGLITDLDDTLWRGLVGEVGPDAVAWSLEKGAGLHAAYQGLLRGIAENGALLAIASKNTPEVALAALAREDMRIEKDMFFPIEIGWGAKSEAVARILAAWNIGAEAVAFVDDSPLEVAEVESRFPGITGVVFPATDDDALYEVLQRLRDLFGRTRVTEEDRLRADSIRRSAESGIAHVKADASESFLKGLEATLTFRFGIDPADERPLELINKTNQFNLNGRRIEAADWKRQLRENRTFTIAVGYTDKFGPLGTIAVLAGTSNGDRVEVSSWVLSCRAFARRIEHATLAVLCDHLGAATIAFDYRATERNLPVQAFLQDIGAVGDEDSGLTLVHTSQVPFPALYHKRVLHER